MLAQFLIRSVGFALIICAGAWLGLQEWSILRVDGEAAASAAGGSGAFALARLIFFTILVIGPFACAAAETVVRRTGVFLAFFLAGAFASAPFAIARALG